MALTVSDKQGSVNSGAVFRRSKNEQVDSASLTKIFLKRTNEPRTKTFSRD